MDIKQNILETIGNTPHVRINSLFGDSHEVWIKLERSNPGAGVWAKSEPASSTISAEKPEIILIFDLKTQRKI